MSTNANMSDNNKDLKPDGAAFGNFESLGKKAEQITGNDSSAAIVNSTSSKTYEPATTEDDDSRKVVDEIESLCMNCHENVCLRGKFS
jgi:zinc finger protein